MILVVPHAVADAPAAEALAGDLDHLERDVPDAPAAEPGLQRPPRDVRVERRHLLVAPVLAQLERRVQGRRLVEQADPERGQRAQPVPRAAVRPPQLQEALQPDLGKRRRHVILPILQRGPLSGQRLQLPGEKVTERSAGDVDVAVPMDEVHRDVQHVVRVALEPHAVLEGERQEPRAVGIGVRPHVAPIAQVAVGRSLPERGVGEQRRGDGLQPQRDPHLLHHVGFGRVIEVHLDRAGPEHHLEPERAAGRHVPAHDAVPPLRHHRHVLVLPFRVVSETEKSHVQPGADLLHLEQVRVHLVTGLMKVFEGRARELDGAARLQRHRLPVQGQRDDVPVLEHRRPAEPLQALQDDADADVALERQGAQVAAAVGEFLVLGPDSPLDGRLAAALEIGDEVVPIVYRGRLGVGACQIGFLQRVGRSAGRMGVPHSTSNPAFPWQAPAASVTAPPTGTGERRARRWPPFRCAGCAAPDRRPEPARDRR